MPLPCLSVDALTHETEPRRIDLLIDALAKRLPLAAALRLARSQHPAHRRLLTTCLEARIALADADSEQLAARLYRARLHPHKDRQDPGRTLRIDGFSPEAARALVDVRTSASESAVLATVRAALADWIAWLLVDPDPRALALVLDAAQPHHTEHLEALLTLSEQHLTVDPAALAGLLERCIAGRKLARPLEVRAIDLLRRLHDPPGLSSLPPSPPSPACVASACSAASAPCAPVATSIAASTTPASAPTTPTTAPPCSPRPCRSPPPSATNHPSSPTCASTPAAGTRSPRPTAPPG